MLKKLLRTALFGAFFCGLNVSAEGVRIEIETHDGEVQISVETSDGWSKKLISPPEMYIKEDKTSAPAEWRFDDRDGDGRIEWTGVPLCADDLDCVETCKELYRRGEARENCTYLSTVSVGKIKEVVETLKAPDEDNLNEMSLDALKLLLSISAHPLERAMDTWSRVMKQDFLLWLAEDMDVADMIGKADDDEFFVILRKLFIFNSNSGLNKSVNAGNSFVEIALYEGNDEALEWVHGFFEYHLCDDDFRKSHEKCMLRQYCALELDKQSEKDYLDYELFEDMLDTILRYHRPENAPDWWDKRANAFVNSTDLDTWKSGEHNVCAAMGMVEAESKTGEVESQQVKETEKAQTSE